MPAILASNLKFVGTVSLGLLTGLSYSLHSVTTPPLLLLPTAAAASTTLAHLQSAAAAHQRRLAFAAAASTLVAYLAAPPRARHPYLLWVFLATALGAAVDPLASRCFPAGDGDAPGRARTAADRRPDIVEMDSEEEEEINGEEVREGLDRFRARQAVKAAVWGAGLLMAVVGIWGDGA